MKCSNCGEPAKWKDIVANKCYCVKCSNQILERDPNAARNFELIAIPPSSDKTQA